jgi:DNA polymerase (family 10)
VSGPTLPDVLRQLSCLADIRGSLEAADLRAAVTAIDALPRGRVDALLHDLQSGGKTDLPFGSPIDRIVRDIATLGSEPVLAAARLRIPSLFRWLLDLGAVTHDQASHLACDLGLATLPDLQAALDDRRFDRRLPTGIEDRLVRAAQAIAEQSTPVPLGRALDVLEAVESTVIARCPFVDEMMIAGDARRFEPLVSALVLVARTSLPSAAVDALSTAHGIDAILFRSGRRVLLEIQHLEVDVRLAAPDDYGTVLFHATGSRAHVNAVAGRRRRPELCSREADVYTHAGLPAIEPEIRNDSGEIEAAEANRLPRLVERKDIRGDFHMHSTYSDGQDTIEMMVAASAALGYEYIAITDHSERAAASRTVTVDLLKRQRDEIDRVRELHPHLTILHGIEVDILPDGTLDFGDDILASLDIVIASLHERAGHDGATLTRRCLKAIHHPLVNILSHPANQLVGRRPGYPLEYERIYEAAVETGTALEIDGAPSHLDLDGEHARAAVAAGVTVTIDSDSHRARALDRQMRLGIGTARRGWVEARSVLNSRSIADVRAWIRAKRSRTS